MTKCTCFFLLRKQLASNFCCFAHYYVTSGMGWKFDPYLEYLFGCIKSSRSTANNRNTWDTFHCVAISPHNMPLYEASHSSPHCVLHYPILFSHNIERWAHQVSHSIDPVCCLLAFLRFPYLCITFLLSSLWGLASQANIQIKRKLLVIFAPPPKKATLETLMYINPNIWNTQVPQNHVHFVQLALQ